MEAYENLLYRRSIKRYTDRKLDEETISKIVEAGMYAPSGSNKQDTAMIVVTNEDEIKELNRLNGLNGGRENNFYGAPCVIVVLADVSDKNWAFNGALVMGNLLNAASALNVGSCWINRAYETFNSDEGKALLKKWGFNLENYVGVGNCILGYLDGDYPKAAPRKENRVMFVK